MQPSPPRPNTPFGPYHLMRLLARGGMGHVFLARTGSDPGVRNRVVVKVLLPDLAAQKDMRAMFLHEARLGSLLQHENIAQIHDYGEQDGVLYLAMEYVDGLPLSAVMRRLKGRVPLGSALRIVADVAAALGYAHGAVGPTGEPLQVVHRDVTPQNILISRRGLVKLIDFGVAKSSGQDHRTRTGVLKGKLAYMAPEQFRGQTSNRTDIFALGVVMHELISAKRLFRRPTEAETFAAILTDPVPALRAEPRVARVLQPIVDRALCREVDRRYADAGELEGDVRAAMRQLRLGCSPQDLARLAAVPRPLESDRRGATEDAEAPDPGATSASGMRMRDEETGRSSEEWHSASGFGPGESATSVSSPAQQEPQVLPFEGVEDTIYDPALLDEMEPGQGGRAAGPPRFYRHGGSARPRWALWIAAAAAAALGVTGVALSLSKGKMERVIISAPPPNVGEPASPEEPTTEGAKPTPAEDGQGISDALARTDTLPSTAGERADLAAVGAEGSAANPDAKRSRLATKTKPDTSRTKARSAKTTRRSGSRRTEPDPQSGSGTGARGSEAEDGSEATAESGAGSGTASRDDQARAPRATRPAPRPPPPPGNLYLDTDPWTFVKIGGRTLGQTPILNVELPAGRHVLELREGGGRIHRVPIHIAPGRPTKKFLRLGE